MQNRQSRLLKGRERLSEAFGKWHLINDGEIITRSSSLLQPVLFEGVEAMLKVALHDEEQRGMALMACWNGHGAAKTIKCDKDTLLMERATGKRSLRQMVLNGDEDEANKIVCGVAAKLHRANCMTMPELTPLKIWFSSLRLAATKYGSVFSHCRDIADQLLDRPKDITVLHGDIHYDNILDSGKGEWVAIDPKALLGERGFDFANLFCNPTAEVAMSGMRLQRQARLVAGEAGLDLKRLLQWIIAWGGLSASWMLEDGKDPQVQLSVAQNALNELSGF